MLPTRRAVFGAAAGTAIGLVGSARAQTRRTGKTYVLVHGAWHGGWCWRRVGDLLAQEGHRVFAPTLTGLGERSHLLTKDVNATTHVTDVANVIQWEDLSDVVLVGHSYGGVAISGVADRMPEKLAAIVFLDAFVPQDGESVAETSSQNTRGIIEASVARNELAIKSPPASVFGVAAKDQPSVDSKLTPQPVAAFTEKVGFQGGRDKIAKKMFIRATQWPSATFDANLARAKKDGWETHEFTTGHDVMVIEPEQLGALLLKA